LHGDGRPATPSRAGGGGGVGGGLLLLGVCPWTVACARGCALQSAGAACGRCLAVINRGRRGGGGSPPHGWRQTSAHTKQRLVVCCVSWRRGLSKLHRATHDLTTLWTYSLLEGETPRPCLA
jgi:hypothetical protein